MERKITTDYEIVGFKGLRRVFDLITPRLFRVRLPDGSIIDAEEGYESRFTLVLHHPEVLRQMLIPYSELRIGEGYIFDAFDIEGDVVEAFKAFHTMKIRRMTSGQLLRNLFTIWQLGNKQMSKRLWQRHEQVQFSHSGRQFSTTRDQAASKFHYDLSNDFYKLWLDKRLVYSSAYYQAATDTIDKAQKRKLSVICNKLNMQSGDRFLDIGCGWGGLLIHAAKQFDIQAYGISVSEAQTVEARERIEKNGLGDCCEVRLSHYAEFHIDVPFDKVASVGMFEHVGLKQLPAYFQSVSNLLKPGGLFLLQGSTGLNERPNIPNRWQEYVGIGRGEFFQRYVFPDCYLPDLPSIFKAAEDAGFELKSTESIREHYVLTIRTWLARLEENRVLIISTYGLSTYRRWKLLFAFCIYFMDQQMLGCYQFVFERRH